VSSAGDSQAFEELVDPDEQLVQIGSGYEFGEGPVWDPIDGCLYFCDLPGDTRWRWTEERGMEVAMRPAFKAGGLSMDPDGNLVACEHVGSSVTRYTRDGRREVIGYHARGEYLNSPNDIVVRSDGSVYFTDPDYGRWNDWIGVERNRGRFRGIYRIPPDGDGEALLLVDEDEFDEPNGICFSPDESILYVNDSPRAHVKAFDVAPDGSVSGGRVLLDGIGGGFGGDIQDGADEEAVHQALHDAGAVDGMRCDERGNVWVTGPGGIWVIDPGGTRLGVVRAPEVVGNLAWGGSDLHTLFVLASTTVHKIRTKVGPAPLPHHRAGAATGRGGEQASDREAGAR
jgi:gluconolactonase